MQLSLRFADWPLRAKMAGLLVVASLLPLLVGAFIELRQERARVLDGMKSLLRARGDQIARELDAFHRSYLRAVEQIAHLPGATAYCSDGSDGRRARRDALLNVLSSYVASDGGIRGMALIDGSGRVVIATEPGVEGADLADRPVVQRALQGHTVVSDPFISPPRTGSVPTIVYMRPMAGSDGKIACVAALYLRATALWDTVKTSHALAGPGSFAVLFDREGIRVAHTASDDVVFHPGGVLAPTTLERVVAERRFGAATRSLLEDVRPFAEQFERARAEALDPEVFRGFAPATQSWTYGVGRRFATVPWTVFYMVPEAAVDAEIALATRARALVAFAVIGAVTLVGVLFAGGIVRPVRALTRAATAMAGGDYSARVHSDGAGELGRLGRSFDAMAERIEVQTAQLQGARDELEQRVQQRTAELLRTTEDLRAEIAERKQSELALRASEERTRLIVDTALDAVVTMDGDGLITGWSPQAQTTFGWARAEAIGRPLAQAIVPEAHRDAHRRGLQRYLAGGASVVLNRRVELTALHKDGHEFPVDLSITPISVAGRPAFSAFVRDITERKQSQARAQAQLERMTLLDQITRAIGERQDLRSIYQVAIRSLEERLPVDFACVCRYDPVDDALTVVGVGVRSQPLAQTLAMGERARIAIDANGLARCMRGELVYEPDVRAAPFAFPQRLAGGGLASLVVAPLQSESRVFGVLVAARHAAQAFSSGECEFLRQLSAHVALAARHAELHGALQQAYDDLRQSQQTVLQQERLRALGQMASGIAHDINNAISPLALYTESLLERETGLSERGRGYLATIARSIDDVAATVARMREFYRQREPELQLTTVRLNTMVEQVVELTRARWSDMPQQRGAVVDLQCELAPDLPAVLGVDSEVREALLNLILNAVDAMPDGGTLTLRTWRDDDRVAVEVTDTGVGMDESTRRRCLEPFFTTKGERGTGLGLAMVYGVAQRHGADLDIDSAPGRGTTVRMTFQLPATEPGVTPATPLCKPAARLHLLLVDDDPMVLETLRETLELDGHAVVTASGGQAGIDAFAHALHLQRPFDVVITDLGMPHVDGRTVAGAVKAASTTTPVVLLTGWGQRLMADGDMPAHVDRVLSKPPKLRDLRTVLAELTNGAASSGGAPAAS